MNWSRRVCAMTMIQNFIGESLIRSRRVVATWLGFRNNCPWILERRTFPYARHSTASHPIHIVLNFEINDFTPKHIQNVHKPNISPLVRINCQNNNNNNRQNNNPYSPLPSPFSPPPVVDFLAHCVYPSRLHLQFYILKIFKYFSINYCINLIMARTHTSN